jgi:hypothetical protein
MDFEYENVPTQTNIPDTSLNSIKRMWGALEYHPIGWKDVLENMKSGPKRYKMKKITEERKAKQKTEQ